MEAGVPAAVALQVAFGEITPAALLSGVVEAQRAWVIDDGLEVAAYLLADMVGGCAHVEQVSVHPRHARRRHRAALIEHLARWTHHHDLLAITLMPYRHVPWNGPYYETLGFRWFPDDGLSPELRALRSEEVERGLDRWPRGCMRRDLMVDAGPATPDSCSENGDYRVTHLRAR